MNTTVSTKVQEKAPPLPWRVKKRVVDQIMCGFLKAGADVKPAHYSHVAPKVGISPRTIRENCRFLTSIDFLKPEGRGQFRLTSSGAELARALDWGREDEAKRLLAALLSSWGVGRNILDLAELSGGIEREELISRVAKSLNLKKSRDTVGGLNVVIDELVYAGLLAEEGEVIKRAKPPALPEVAPVEVEGAEDLPSLVDRAVKVLRETPGIGRELVMGWADYARRR